VADVEPHFAPVPPADLPLVVRRPLYVVLDNLRSAYNVGSIFRTCDAGAVAHLHLCGMSAHPPHTKISKTALGAQDYVPWTYHERVTRAIAALQADGVPVFAAEVAPGADLYHEFVWPQPAAVVFGNEVDGISEKVRARCDGTVRIPMNGLKNSINVATAAGILIYEVLRQWKAL
jgi:tRNA G18 (ribose-2'-O)-methylase SpoU